MDPAIEVMAVSKRFRRKDPFSGKVDVQALSGVSLRVLRGSALAVMGENGAGKTTLAKVLMGLVAPDAGEVRLYGSMVHAPGEAGLVAGFVPGEDRSLFLRLSGLENLRYEAALRGIPPAAFPARLRELGEAFGLSGILEKRAADLSAGQRQRIVLARACLADPAVLVLDEPSRSLDARASRRLWEFLRAERGRGKAVLLCTHRREEAEAVCDRAVVMAGGSVVREETLAGTPSPFPDRPVSPPRPAFARALLGGIRRSFLEDGGTLLSNAFWILGIGFQLASFYFLARLVGGARLLPLAPYGGLFFPFVLVWILFQEVHGSALYHVAAEVRNGQSTGTLETVLLASANPLVAFLPSTLWALAKSALLASVLFAGFCLATGAAPGPAGAALALLAAALAATAALGIGLLGAGVVLVFQRGNFLVPLYAVCATLLAGGYYPPEILPGLLRALAECFPLTPALRLMRKGLLPGGSGEGTAGDLAALAMLAALALAAGLWGFRAALEAARRRGVLGRY